MTPAQLQMLRDYIDSQPDLSSQPMTPDGDYAIASLLNLDAVGIDTIVWRTNIPLETVAGVMSPVELDNLTAQERTRLSLLSSFMALGVNPSNPNVRAFFFDVFSGSGGASTRAALSVLWVRPALRGEWIYVLPPPSPGEPATLTYEGAVSPSDVNTARNLP